MDFGLPFSFPFQDQSWMKKLSIAGLITLIPIVGWFYLLGWGLEITRQIIRGEPVIIPETDFEKFLSRGFKAWVISIVFAIPSVSLQFLLGKPISWPIHFTEMEWICNYGWLLSHMYKHFECIYYFCCFCSFCCVTPFLTTMKRSAGIRWRNFSLLKKVQWVSLVDWGH